MDWLEQSGCEDRIAQERDPLGFTWSLDAELVPCPGVEELHRWLLLAGSPGPGIPGQNAGEEKQLASHFNFRIQKKFYRLFLAKWYVALGSVDSRTL